MSVTSFRAPSAARRLLTLATTSAVVATAVFAPDANAALPPNLDFRTLTAQQIIQDYTNRVYTPTELTQAYLNRIATYNPVYNAYTTMNPSVLADAAALTAQLSNPSFVPPTPLWGVPTAIKDPVNVAGLRTTVGSSYFGTTTIGTGGVVVPGAVEMIPATDSPIAARLRSAGALILGKTSVPDFSVTGSHSNSTLNGITRNAYNIGRTPGGSSGGSGAAVSLGLATIATAEETGSSITNPSSVNGIVGIRPTFGTIPSTGTFPLSGYFRDTNGPFGKTVRDAAAMYDIVGGPNIDARPAPALNNIPAGGFVKYINDNPNALVGKRIAALNLDGQGFSTTNVTNTNTRALFQRVRDVLTAEGATVVEDPFGDSSITLAGTTSIGNGTNAASPATWRNLISNVPAGSTQSWDVRQYLLTLGPGAAFSSPEEYDALYSAASGRTFFNIPTMPGRSLVNGVEQTGDPALRPDLDAIRARTAQLRAIFKQIMTSLNLDALVLPQLAAPAGAFPANPNQVTISRTPGAAVNIIGNPGVVVPGGFFDDGTPFATYFIGDLNDDADILAIAADYEAATQYRLSNLPVLVTAVPEPSSLVVLVSITLCFTRRPRRREQPVERMPA